MKQLVLFFVHLIILPEACEYAASLIDRLLFGRLLAAGSYWMPCCSSKGKTWDISF
jgi:hypothetical protein